MYVSKYKVSKTVLLQVAYGMTETSPLSFMSMACDSPARQATTVGYVMDHVEVSFYFHN
jgi:long-subunit acyl-CoA synthetase (AMP-forming)